MIKFFSMGLMSVILNMAVAPTAFANNEMAKTSLHDHERADMNETSCPPQENRDKCMEMIKKRLKSCKENVTMEGNLPNEASVKKCEEFSRAREEHCNKSCKKEIQ